MSILMKTGTNSKNLIYGIGIVGLILVVLSFVIFDEEPQQKESLTGHEIVQADSTNYTVPARPDLGGYLFKVIIITGIILVLIVIIARWYGKFSQIKTGPSRIKILAKHSLGPKQLILLIKIEGRKLLLGATEKSINLLSDMGIAEDSDEDNYEPISEPASFATILKHFRKGKNE